jgi:hypothetical protein
MHLRATATATQRARKRNACNNKRERERERKKKLREAQTEAVPDATAAVQGCSKNCAPDLKLLVVPGDVSEAVVAHRRVERRQLSLQRRAQLAPRLGIG